MILLKQIRLKLNLLHLLAQGKAIFSLWGGGGISCDIVTGTNRRAGFGGLFQHSKYFFEP